MIRTARAGDEPVLEEFLSRHAETSMFLRSNLAAHGLSEERHAHGTRFYLQQSENRISAVVGKTNHGFLMCQAPDATPELWQVFARVLDGQAVCGMTGEAAQVTDALAALGLAEKTYRLNHIEPLYRLNLSELPDHSPVRLRPAEPDDRELLHDWFAAYQRETGLAGDETTLWKDVQAQVNAAVGSASLRLLMMDGMPRAMTSFNAQVGDMVQVAGVFVPPEFRNLGYGRRIVAAHLAEARRNGIVRAILFANNPPAERAYQAIGFKLTGSYRVAILDRPERIGGDA